MEEDCARCPKTSALLNGVPDLQTAFFSNLEPAAQYCSHPEGRPSGVGSRAGTDLCNPTQYAALPNESSMWSEL
ncbi:hypothetical protein [Paraburkholderia sp. GAS348]|uniref:hypothetical protein n=1 Tax=Paraburkholderia sp. GAS348 TaxID=3035132 RepID=UPI003D2186BC